MEKVDYTLAEESFEVYVPAAYTGDKPYGLLVFVNPHPSGRLPRQYQAAIDKHRLIFVSPNKVGNDRVFRNRMGLAIDAATNLKARYKVDPERVYVAGISGGGRISSMLGMCYPDVFRGGWAATVTTMAELDDALETARANTNTLSVIALKIPSNDITKQMLALAGG